MPPINPLVDILGNWVHQFLIEALRTGHGYEKLRAKVFVKNECTHSWDMMTTFSTSAFYY